MKKIILLLALLAPVLCMSQDQSLKFSGTNLSVWSGSATSDTITNNDTLYNMDYKIATTYPFKYDFAVQMHKTSGVPKVVIQPQYKKFEDDSWASMGSAVTWHGTTADSTIKFAGTTTAVYYRYVRLNFDANTTSQKSYIKKVSFILWDK
jgi:hypothetical protein